MQINKESIGDNSQKILREDKKLKNSRGVKEIQKRCSRDFMRFWEKKIGLRWQSRL